MEWHNVRHFRVLLVAFSLALGAGTVAAQSPAQLTETANLANANGDYESERALLEKALDQLGTGNPEAFALLTRLAQLYSDTGESARALAMSQAGLKVASGPGKRHSALVRLVSQHASLHQLDQARVRLAELELLMKALRGNRGWGSNGFWWQAGFAKARAALETRAGHFEPAEQAWKACITTSRAAISQNRDREGSGQYVDCTRGLLELYIATGRLADAGQLADQLRVAADLHLEAKKRPAVLVRVNQGLARLAIEQGKLNLAQQLLDEALATLSTQGNADNSLRAAGIYLQRAQIEMLRNDWNSALGWHHKRDQLLKSLGTGRGQRGSLSLDYSQTLLRLGNTEDALQMVQQIVNARNEVLDVSSVGYWEVRVYLGIALSANGRKDEALQDLRQAVPQYLDLIKAERSSNDAGVFRTARLNWLLDGYIGVLGERAAAGDAAAMDEAFRMADLARGSTVQRALAASASRANISDPALADLARQEQDLQREISSLAESIGNLLSRGRISEQDKIVADMRTNLNKLREEHTRTQAAIERRFPDYAALLNPKPVGMSVIQKLLKPTEAVVSVYAGSDRSMVWAIPAQGSPRFAIVPLTAAQLDQIVTTLREALDPNADAAGRLPKFRFDLSHELYNKLLAPVEAGWKGAQELIVIPHGRLGQLPFGVLTTAPFSVKPAKLDYAEMAEAPWLIKQIAVSQLPAAVAMPALRAGAGQKAERPFVGFGDPVFMADAAAAVAGTRGVKKRGIQRRNLSIVQAAVAKPEVEPAMAPPINFKLLPQLPDTSLEIQEVGGVLSADKNRDIFLFERASESLVKQTDLSPYRVVMFATHGLMNGEMPGLYQPALALTNPSVSGEKEDGMLTMEEILGLKLKADWVVLSACNSAAAGGQSSESVSGLGRAFFYAGAKSLLVTNWAVETESARMLTTEAFRSQAKDPALPRARALQQSSLSLMKKSAGNDFSYAHPMFWAPYTLVGDGG